MNQVNTNRGYTTAPRTEATEHTYSVDIRKEATNRCGLTFKEMSMSDSVAGVLVHKDSDSVMHLNDRIDEMSKRMAIAQALAVCLKENNKVNVVVGRTVPEDVDAIARRLVMPEPSFRHEEKRLQSFGALRYSILSTLFLVPLAQVMLWAKELELLDK